MDAGAASQAERSKRWRVGVAARLDEIKTKLEQLNVQINAQLAAITDRMAEQDRQAGRCQ